MSTHEIPIIEIKDIQPHPNADRLSLVKVYGWQCCIGKEQFKNGDKAVYIPPDFEVPNTESFAFLFSKNPEKEWFRIRVQKMRGLISQGLIISLPEYLSHKNVGDNVIAELGIRRYEPVETVSTSGDVVGVASVPTPKFDVENIQRYSHVLSDWFGTNGNHVIISEKIHGTNTRFMFDSEYNSMMVGGRTQWLKESSNNVYWKAFRLYSGIDKFCRKHPMLVLYGETFGCVQDLKYGMDKGKIDFRAFALYNTYSGKWTDWNEFVDLMKLYEIPVVPYSVWWFGDLDMCLNTAREIAERDSQLCKNQMSEGVVIVPMQELWNEEIGRVCLKLVSNRYLSK